MSSYKCKDDGTELEYTRTTEDFHSGEDMDYYKCPKCGRVYHEHIGK